MLWIFSSDLAVSSSAEYPYHLTRYSTWPFFMVYPTVVFTMYSYPSCFAALGLAAVGKLSSFKLVFWYRAGTVGTIICLHFIFGQLILYQH